jgi:hypothetical protein
MGRLASRRRPPVGHRESRTLTMTLSRELRVLHIEPAPARPRACPVSCPVSCSASVPRVVLRACPAAGPVALRERAPCRAPRVPRGRPGRAPWSRLAGISLPPRPLVHGVTIPTIGRPLDNCLVHDLNRTDAKLVPTAGSVHHAPQLTRSRAPLSVTVTGCTSSPRSRVSRDAPEWPDRGTPGSPRTQAKRSAHPGEALRNPGEALRNPGEALRTGLPTGSTFNRRLPSPAGRR